MQALKVLKFTGFGILGVGAMFFFVWLVMLLWNALIPELFDGPEMTYWQTAGIMILSKILLSGFGGGGKNKRGHYKSKHKSRWMSKYNEKYKDGCKEEETKAKDVDPEVQPG